MGTTEFLHVPVCVLAFNSTYYRCLVHIPVMGFVFIDTLSPFYFLEVNLRIRIEACIYVQYLFFIKSNLKASFIQEKRKAHRRK